jgi:hypothetical protein
VNAQPATLPRINSDAVTYTGRTDGGAWARAVDVARRLAAAGLWDGATAITVHDPYPLHAALAFGDITPDELEPGTHYTLEAAAVAAGS